MGKMKIRRRKPKQVDNSIPAALRWDQLKGVEARVEAFDKLYEKEGPAVRCGEGGTWLIYPGGATRELNPKGRLKDPPENQQELAKKKAYYWQIISDRAVSTFHKRKREHEMHLSDIATTKCIHNSRIVINENIMLKDLEELKEIANLAQKNLKKAQDDIEKAIPDSVKARKKMDAELRFEASEVLNKIAQIQL